MKNLTLYLPLITSLLLTACYTPDLPVADEIAAPQPAYDEPWANSDKKAADETLEVTTYQGEDLRAYLWLPENHQPELQYKAVVMAHGCGGAHWQAQKIAGKFKVWAKLLNEQGIMVLLVDSFTTRDENGDVAAGVCDVNYADRPDKIDPISVRPADIAAGIQYMNQRADVEYGAVGVLSFSNGATSALALANHEALANNPPDNKTWYNLPFADEYKAREIVALYPGCGLNGYSDMTQDIFVSSFTTYTATHLYAADNDTSLPANTLELCSNLENLDNGWGMSLEILDNTNHQFDYKQHTQPNVSAAIDDIINLFVEM